MRHFLLASIACASLIGCANSTVTPIEPAAERTYPYTTALPSAEMMKTKYLNVQSTLSPMDRYHFHLSVPVGWRALDISLQKEPEAGGFTEMAVYREPGEWETNAAAGQGGEIAITAVNAVNDSRTAAEWLQGIIKDNVPDVEIMEEHTRKVNGDEALDLLFKYKQKGKTIVTRMGAFRQDDRYFLISVSDSEEGYTVREEPFYVALATFRLDKDLTANPFYVQ